jgi:hypothetical protein
MAYDPSDEEQFAPEYTKTKEGFALCVGTFCIGCVFGDETFYSPGWSSWYLRMEFDDDRQIAYNKAMRVGFDLRDDFVEVKELSHFDEDQEGFAYFMGVNAVESPEDPMIKKKYNVPIAFRRNGKIMVRKLQMYRCEVTRATFPDEAWTLYPHVFGQTWSLDVAWTGEEESCSTHLTDMFSKQAPEPQEDPKTMVWGRIRPLKKIVLQEEEFDDEMIQCPRFGFAEELDGEVEEFR